MKCFRISVSAFALIALAACSSVEDLTAGLGAESQQNLSAAELKVRELTNRQRVASAAIQGCVGTAFATGMITILAGGSGQQALQNSAIGCVAGAAVGAAAGVYVNARANQISDRQAYYRNLVAAADEDIKRYDELTAATRALIAEEREQIASLNRRLQANEVSREEYSQQLRSARSNVKLIESSVDEIDGNAKTIGQDISTLGQQGVSDTAALSERKRKLEAQREELRGLVSTLVGTYESAPADLRPEVS